MPIDSSSAEPPTELQPWQWPEARWRGVVNRVGAGRRLRPSVWKNGARCAVAISFDSDHESAELRRGGHSVGRISSGQYGNRVGIPRIERLLERHGAQATFYVPAVTALLHPDEQRRLVAAGHEIGLHGWIHEDSSTLPREAERELVLRSIETLETVTKLRPAGVRTPGWELSPDTIRILTDAGLAYDSSLMADDDCYELLTAGQPSGLVEVPVEWIRDDAIYLHTNLAAGMRPFVPPADVWDIFRREFDAAYAEGGLFQLTLHPHVIGHRSRIWILDEVLRHAASHRGVWFATHRDVAAWAKEHAAG